MPRLSAFWFGHVDIAPVALFRILFGVQLFNWFWQLYPNLAAFFSDEGILPRSALLQAYPDRASLLLLAGEWWQVALIWVASCGVAIAVTIGWKTRWACLSAFVLVSAFSWRNPLILDGSDFVFRLLPLWLGLTECGALYSLDAIARGRTNSGHVWALPVRMLELQVAWIFLATGLEKLGGPAWIDGNAAYYALQLNHTFARPWAEVFATNPFASRAISWGTLLVELGFLPLAMIPSARTRLVAAAGAAVAQLGILALMNVGNFPVVMLTTLVLFLPGDWIRRLFGGKTGNQGSLVAKPRAWRAVGLAALAMTSFLTAVPWELETLRPHGDVASLLRFLSLDQRWDMFSPDPAHSELWLLAPATLADGTAFDLLAPSSEGVERHADPLYSRWMKVNDRIASRSYSDFRLEYARSFCRLRNLHLQPGQSRLVSFELFYVERTIQAPGRGAPLIQDELIWTHRC